MSSLFSKPKIPKPEPAKPAPTVDDARLRVDAAQSERKRRGRAASQVVSDETTVSTAAKVLTGN